MASTIISMSVASAKVSHRGMEKSCFRVTRCHIAPYDSPVLAWQSCGVPLTTQNILWAQYPASVCSALGLKDRKAFHWFWHSALFSGVPRSHCLTFSWTKLKRNGPLRGTYKCQRWDWNPGASIELGLCAFDCTKCPKPGSSDCGGWIGQVHNCLTGFQSLGKTEETTGRYWGTRGMSPC